MALKLIVDVVCDLHDSDPIPAARPVRFGINGRVYDVDACPGCTARLLGLLDPIISRARQAGVLPGLLPDQAPRRRAAAGGKSRREHQPGPGMP
jgi:hypothetical protein